MDGLHFIKFLQLQHNEMKRVMLVFTLVCVKCSVVDSRSNVCKTFIDYYTDLDKNPNCYYNPDVDLSEPDIIRRHGYPLEIHSVTTKDGYILSLFRIPYGKTSTTNVTGPPVLMLPGLLSSSVQYYFRGNTSLGFILSDQGYDVWFGNFRGTEFSNKHVSLNNRQGAYWNFSFHEMGIYDLPAKIDYITQVTGQKVIYIGLSMGTTSFYVYGTEYPDDACNKVRLAISLAPVAYVLHHKSDVFRIIFPLWPVIEKLWYSISNGPVFIRKTLRDLVKRVCLPYPFQMDICYLFSSLYVGYDPEQLVPEHQPIMYTQFFDASSIKTMSHFRQIAMTDQFKRFDYGSKNKEVYGTDTPPEYRLSKMKVPNYFMRAENDLLATKENVELTFAGLPPRAKPFDIYVVKDNKFNHADFITAKDVMRLVYDHIVEFLRINGPRFP